MWVNKYVTTTINKKNTVKRDKELEIMALTHIFTESLPCYRRGGRPLWLLAVQTFECETHEH
jgi:hypothetical protein